MKPRKNTRAQNIGRTSGSSCGHCKSSSKSKSGSGRGSSRYSSPSGFCKKNRRQRCSPTGNKINTKRDTQTRTHTYTHSHSYKGKHEGEHTKLSRWARVSAHFKYMEGQASTAAAAAEAATVTAQSTALPATTASWGNITKWSMSELRCVCVSLCLFGVSPRSPCRYAMFFGHLSQCSSLTNVSSYICRSLTYLLLKYAYFI